jgi:hypothetical protein
MIYRQLAAAGVSVSVVVQPSGVLASAPATGTLILSPTAAVQPAGILASGPAFTVSGTSSDAATVAPQGILASGTLLTLTANNALACLPQGTLASGPQATALAFVPVDATGAAVLLLTL